MEQSLATNDESSYQNPLQYRRVFSTCVCMITIVNIFFQFSYRRDASSNFHSDTSLGKFLFMLELAWLLNKESWLKEINWIDLLKLKFSIGQQGNDSYWIDFRYVDIYSIRQQQQ